MSHHDVQNFERPQIKKNPFYRGGTQNFAQTRKGKKTPGKEKKTPGKDLTEER